MRNVLGLDHVIILVRDLDDAERRMARLGFRPTPRGVHSPEMGTANATVMLRDGTYFETLTVLAPTPANADARAALAGREGAFGLALKTDDARAAAAEFAAAGIGDGDALAFSRPVELPGGRRDAAFTIARIRAGATPGAWIFVCQHHTPEVVWREDHLDHPNGVLGLAEVIGVADDLDALARAYAVLFGERVEQRSDRVTIRAGDAAITFLTAEALTERAGMLGAPSGSGPRLVGLSLRVADAGAVAALLAEGGVRYTEEPDGTVQVPPGEACGTLLEFAPARR